MYNSVETSYWSMNELGDQPGCVCADSLTQQGCQVQMVTPDRAIAYELGPTNSSVALRNLSLHGVTFETHQRLTAVELKGNQKLAQLTHVLTNQVSTRTVNHVVVEHGSTPMDGLYFDLKTDSINDGELDQEALIQGQSPFIRTKKPGQYYLARIGDAIASRNIHAALYDAIRVCKDL